MRRVSVESKGSLRLEVEGLGSSMGSGEMFQSKYHLP